MSQYDLSNEGYRIWPLAPKGVLRVLTACITGLSSQLRGEFPPRVTCGEYRSPQHGPSGTSRPEHLMHEGRQHLATGCFRGSLSGAYVSPGHCEGNCASGCPTASTGASPSPSPSPSPVARSALFEVGTPTLSSSPSPSPSPSPSSALVGAYFGPSSAVHPAVTDAAQ